MRTILVGLMALFGTGPVLAQEMAGDPAAGQAIFDQKCISCHVVENEAGELLAGRSGRSGPNLYGVAGRVPGSMPEVRYSDQLVAYGETGAVWEEANFVAFVPDPSGFLREVLGMPPSKVPISRMPTGVIREEQQAHDVWAYLATFSPAAGDGAAGEAGAEAPTDGQTASE